MRKYQEKIDQFLKNVLFQADGRERLGNDLSYDDETWRAQYLDANNSVSAKKNFFEGCRVVPGFPVDGHIYGCMCLYE